MYILRMVWFETVEICSIFNEYIWNYLCEMNSSEISKKEDNITNKNNSLMILFVRSNDLPVSSLKFFISDSRWPKNKEDEKIRKNTFYFWRTLIILKERVIYDDFVLKSNTDASRNLLETDMNWNNGHKNTFLKKVEKQLVMRILYWKNNIRLANENQTPPQFSWYRFLFDHWEVGVGITQDKAKLTCSFYQLV